MRTRGVAVVLVMVVLLEWASSLSAPPALLAQGQSDLRVSPTSLRFSGEVGGQQPDAQFLTLENVGQSVLRWQASADVGWIILGAPTARISPGQVVKLLMLVDSQGLDAGVRQGTITVENVDAQESPTQVDVTLTLREPPRLEVSPASLSFAAQQGESNPASKTLTIRNTGGQSLSWTASENLGWLKLSRTKGTLDAGENTKVTVTVDVSGLSAGNNKGQIVVLASGAKNSPLFVDVSLTVTGSPAAPQPSIPPAGMALVPAGSFQMGDSFNEGDSDELPVHNVNVSAFYMDKFEVTKGLWDEVAAWASSHGYDIGPDDGSGQARNHPAFNVSWYEAVKWANARSEKEGLTPVYYTSSSQTTVYRTGSVNVKNDWVKWTANGYRLPTEAEWEKAARGGCERHRFPWCNVDTIQHARANYWSCPGPQCENTSYSFDTSPTRGPHPDYDNDPQPFTSPVGSFAVNGYGLFDMAGNVWEWNWDWYDGEYYASSPGVDPRGPVSGSLRVSRGGSWIDSAVRVRVADRSFLGPGREFLALGFRLVRAVTSLP